MPKQKEKVDFSSNWYELWMQQSKDFFETADKNLKDLFKNNAAVNPEEHLQQIRQWLDTLKSQWQVIQLNEQQRLYENYWKAMAKMCNDAADMLVAEWTKRSEENHPIKNVRELYELWLNCCHKAYDKAMHTQSYQDLYGDLMNNALKYWKSVIPK